MSEIHPTAVVEKGARLGAHVTIGPYACVNKNVVLEENVTIMSHAYIDGHTTIGQGTVIYPGAVIGTKTQDLKYRGEVTYVTIGKECQIRECVTINASCGEGTSVTIGDRCLLMAYCHVAHNSTIGNRVVMANSATLAGHVTVEDCAVIGGLSAVHQFARIGRYAMVGGMSRVTHDVPPFTIGAGTPYKIGGLNLVGLKRHGFTLEKRKLLTQAFRLLYRAGLPVHEALERTKNELAFIPEIEQWLEFCTTSKRGLIDTSRSKMESKDEEEEGDKE